LKRARDQCELLDKECAVLKQQLSGLNPGGLSNSAAGGSKNNSPPKAPNTSEVTLLRKNSSRVSVVPESLLEAIRKGQQLRHVVRVVH